MIITRDTGGLSPNTPSSADLDSLLLSSYRQCIYNYPGQPPDFFKVRNIFFEDVIDRGLQLIYTDTLGRFIHVDDISEDLLEIILNQYGAHFIDMTGEELNDCQQKLFEGWYEGFELGL